MGSPSKCADILNRKSMFPYLLTENTCANNISQFIMGGGGWILAPMTAPTPPPTPLWLILYAFLQCIYSLSITLNRQIFVILLAYFS